MLLLFEMTLNLTLNAVHLFKPDTQWSGLSLVTRNHLFLPATVVKSAGYSQFENESNIISMQLNTLFCLQQFHIISLKYVVNTMESKHASIINVWRCTEILPSRFF